MDNDKLRQEAIAAIRSDAVSCDEVVNYFLERARDVQAEYRAVQANLSQLQANAERMIKRTTELDAQWDKYVEDIAHWMGKERDATTDTGSDPHGDEGSEPPCAVDGG